MNIYEEHAVMKARLELCQELNDFLKANNRGFWGFLGLIPWWSLNKLLCAWLDENSRRLAIRHPPELKSIK